MTREKKLILAIVVLVILLILFYYGLLNFADDTAVGSRITTAGQISSGLGRDTFDANGDFPNPETTPANVIYQDYARNPTVLASEYTMPGMKFPAMSGYTGAWRNINYELRGGYNPAKDVHFVDGLQQKMPTIQPPTPAEVKKVETVKKEAYDASRFRYGHKGGADLSSGQKLRLMSLSSKIDTQPDAFVSY